MHRHRFHEVWILPLLVLFLYHTNTFAQCPLTKSATFKMLPQGIPNRVQLEPTDFLLNSTDTAFYKKLSLSQDRFLCVEVGIQEVLLSGVNVISGDSFSCPEYVWVIDSVLLCSDEIITPKAVAGTVTTEKGEVVPNVAMGLSSGAINYFKGTNERGAFFFDDFETEQFELAPGDPFDNNVRNGITTFDVLLLQKHILNLRPLDSPYKLIAADLNNSGDVTAFDMFVDAAHQFEDVTNPFDAPIPNSIAIDAINEGPQLDNRFIAIKMGDLNNTVKLGLTGRNKTKLEEGKPILTITENTFKKGDIINVPLTLTKELAVEGIQFALGYDAQHLRFLGMNGTAELNDEHYAVENGLITMSWTNAEPVVFDTEEMILNLQFTATEAGLLSETIHLMPHQLAPIIYTEAEGSIPFSLDWGVPNLPIKAFKAFDNYPNPFNNQTTISFLLPQNSLVTLQVFDNNGRTILTKQQEFTAGKQTLQINEKLPTTGLYLYRLESEFGIATGRMNYVEL